MPTILFTSPLTLSNSATTAQGFLADAYTGSQPNFLADIGFMSMAGRGTFWALAVNTPIQTGNVAATFRKGDVTQAGTLFVNNSRGFAGTLGAIGTWVAVDSASVASSAHLGVRFQATSVANAGGVTARAAMRYVLNPNFNDQIVGVGAVNPVFAKTSSHAFVPMGQPAVGPWTQTSEALAQTPWASRGIFTGATVVAYSSTPEFPVTFGLRINGATTGITVTVSPTTYRVFSVGGVASIAFSDSVCWEVTASSWATGSYFYGFVQTRFTPAQTTAPFPVLDPTSGQAIIIDSGAGFTAWMTTISHAALPGWFTAGNVTGVLQGTIAFASDPILSDKILAFPFLCPRSGAVVGAMGVVVTGYNGTGGHTADLAIYEARSTAGHDLYPGSLVAVAGGVNISAVGAQTITTSIQLKADTLYYAAMNASSGFGPSALRVLRGIRSGDQGMPFAVSTDGTGVYGWSVYRTQAAGMPGSFPVTSTEAIQEGTFPAIAYRYIL